MRTGNLQPASERFAYRVAIFSILAGGAGLIGSWFTRAFAQDDFFFSYVAWLRTTDLIPNKDYYLPNFTPLAEIASPLYRQFPESMLPLDISRALMLIPAVLLIVLVWKLTLALSGSKHWAAIATVITLWQRHFMSRIADVRSDQIGAMFLLAAILVLVRETPTPTLRRYWMSGLLYGAAITATYKLGVATPFITIAILIIARDKITSLILHGAAAAIPLSVYFLWRVDVDGWPTVSTTWHEIMNSVDAGAYSDIRTMSFGSWFFDSTFIFSLIVLGAILSLLRMAIDRKPNTQGVYTLLTIGFLGLFLWLNPFFYPYNFVIFVPLLAPLITGLSTLFDTQGAAGLFPALMMTIASLAVLAGIPEMVESYIADSTGQRSVVNWIWSATAEDEAVFDWQGFHFGRPGTYHWWHYGGLQKKYEEGWYTVEDEIRKAQVTLIVGNYRLLALTAPDREFVEKHFVQIDRCLLVPGRLFRPGELATETKFETFLTRAEFQLTGVDPGSVRIDGAALSTDLLTLAAGSHSISTVSDPRSSATLVYYSPRRNSERPCPADQLLPQHN